MTSPAIRRTWLTLVGAAAIGSFALVAQTPAPAGQTPPAPSGTPPAQGGAAGAQGAGAAGRGAIQAPAPGRGRGLAGAPPINPNDVEFSPKPAGAGQDARPRRRRPSCCRPATAWNWSPSDPDIISPAVIEFDGNGRMYVAEFITYMPDADGNRQHDPISRISRWESTRGDGVVRQAHRLRRQAHPAAHGAAARQQQHPHQRDRFGRRHQADRHQRRRRRGQEGNLLHGRRPGPRRQPRARAERLHLGPRQLDLQHLQRVPLPLDADRHPARTDGAERRPVGPVDG